jgi:hypothetical protein
MSIHPFLFEIYMHIYIPSDVWDIPGYSKASMGEDVLHTPAPPPIETPVLCALHGSVHGLCFALMNTCSA